MGRRRIQMTFPSGSGRGVVVVEQVVRMAAVIAGRSARAPFLNLES